MLGLGGRIQGRLVRLSVPQPTGQSSRTVGLSSVVESFQFSLDFSVQIVISVVLF